MEQKKNVRYRTYITGRTPELNLEPNCEWEDCRDGNYDEDGCYDEDALHPKHIELIAKDRTWEKLTEEQKESFRQQKRSPQDVIR